MIDRQTAEIFLGHNVAISWRGVDGEIGGMEGKAESIDDALQMLVLDWGVAIGLRDILTIEALDVIPREICHEVEAAGGTFRLDGETLRVDGVAALPEDLVSGIVLAKPKIVESLRLKERLERGIDLLLPLELSGKTDAPAYQDALSHFHDLLAQFIALREGEISASTLVLVRQKAGKEVAS